MTAYNDEASIYDSVQEFKIQPSHKQRYPNVGPPGANPDHKHDYLPSEILNAVSPLGFEILQEDTLQDRLAHNVWAKQEALKYGHEDLNFSFEIVARKL